MSKTIENQVVKMEFDNQHFEKNVQTSLSTLEKLKRSLNFKGAADGLNNLNTASSKFNMNGVGTAVDTVNAKFSALQVMGVTALANITNSAVNAGKRITKALTIDPVTTGFKEYETQIGAVQTILANTQHQGTNLDQVNAALDELNKYADKTIYNFTEMTRNIGTFTAAGVDLDKSVQSIKGIANLAAVSGSTSQQASTAMYQLSQALAAGKVSLMDWNSVVNAGMGGKLFQDALVRTSELMKTGAKEAIKMHGSFRESLTKGEWLTTEVLTETLAQLSGAYTKADLLAQGFTEKQAQEIVELSQTAEDAATKVKTFTQLFDTLKETAQSGWTQTWELIVGDFEGAKEYMTKLSEIFGKVIETISNLRNNWLGGALNPFGQFTNKLEKANISIEKFSETLKEVLGTEEVEKLTKEYGSLTQAIHKGKVPVNALKTAFKKLIGVEDKASDSANKMKKSSEELGKVVDEVINGKWGNGEERIKKLTKAGYDWAEVQNLVNEKLGVSKRHLSALTEEQKKNADQLVRLSDEQLKQKGYTEEQIKALRELEKAADDGGTSIDKLIDAMGKPSGRVLLWESILNILDKVGEALNIVKEAWNNVFKTDEEESNSDGLYGMIECFHDMTESMEITEEEATNFQKVMEGLFSIFKLSNSITTMSLNAGLKILNSVLDLFDTNILEVAGHIGELITKFANWVDENTMVMNMIDKIASVIAAFIAGIADCIKAFKELEIIQKVSKKVWKAIEDFFAKIGLAFSGFGPGDITNTIKKAFEDAVNWIKGLDGSEIAKNFIDGMANGFVAGMAKISEIISNIGKMIIETICGVLGIHSPSTEGYEVGKNTMLGIYNGLKDGSLTIWEALKQFGLKIVEILSRVDYGQIFAGGVIVASLMIFKQLVDIVKIFTGPVEALSSMLSGLGGMFNSIGSAFKNVSDALVKNIKARTWAVRAEVIKSFAISVGIMAASIYVLSKLSWGDLAKAGVAIAGITLVLIGLMKAVEHMNTVGGMKTTLNVSAIIGIAASLVIVGIALKQFSDIDLDDVPSILATMTIAVLSMVAIIKSFEMLTNGRNQRSIKAMGWMLIKMSVAFLAMAAVVKLAGSISPSEAKRGVAVLTAVSALFVAFIAASKLMNRNAFISRAGSMLLKVSLALGIMVGVIKIASMLKASEVIKGTAVIVLVGGLFAAFVAVSEYAGRYAARAGAMLLMASVGLMVMTQVVKQAASIEPSEINRGLKVIAALELLFAGLMVVSNFAGPNAIKAGTMLLLVSGALLVLSAVIFILSNIDPKGLYNAVAAITVLGAVFAGLIAVTHFANECKSTLVVITVAIGMLSLVLLALSFIKPEKIAPAVAAITLLMGAFALLIGVTKFAAPGKRALTTLITLTVIVGALAGVVALLANMKNSDQALKATIALSVLLVAFSTSMAILSKSTGVFTIAWGTIVKMVVIITSLAGILGALAYLNVEPSIKSAVALGILLNSMAIAMNILNTVSPTAASALAPLAVMGLIVAELGVVLWMFNKLDIEPSIQTATSLSILLLAMSAALIPLSVAGGVWPAALAGIGVLAAFIAGIGGLITAIGYLVTEFPKLEEFLDTGIPVLEKIGYALGSFFGNIIGGALGGISDGLPEIGSNLAAFMDNAKPFLDGMKGIDASVTDGAKSLAETLLILTSADIMNKMSSFVFGGSSSLSGFGSQLPALGRSMKDFASNLGTFTDDQKTSITCAIETVKAMAEASASIPNEGGWLAAIVGDGTLTTLSSHLPGLGTNLKAFATNLGTFTEEQTETVTCAAKAIKNMAEAAADIPNEGGWITKLVGDNTIATFGAQLPGLGTNLSAFATNLGTFTDAQAETINCAVKAIVNMAKAAEGIDGQAEWAKKIFGDNGIAAFSGQMPTLGTNLKSFITNLGTFSEEQVGTINAAVNAIKSFAKLADSDLKNGKQNLTDFGAALPGFATNISSFCTNLPSGETIATMSDNFSKFVNAIEEITSSKIESIKNFSKTLEDLGKDGVNGFIKSLTSVTAKADVKDATTKLVDKAIEGIEESTTDFEDEFKTMASEGANATKEKQQSFYDAGAYLVTGFANGISANTFKAAAQARAMAAAAARAAEDELDINSPSRVGYGIGDFFGLGFVNAICDYASKAFKASADMANSAREGLKNSIGRIGDLVSDDIETNPTIRPVLDLSNVRSGIGEMDGLFSQGAVVNAGIIGSMANLRNQNGVNADVISALNKLRGDLSNLSKPSYTVNGVTYDDGSAISDAVRSLVRAAKIERRA